MGTGADARTVTVFNTGLAPLTVSAVALAGTDAAAFTLTEVPSLPRTLASGETLTFKVGFLPTLKQAYSARINVTHNGTGESGLPLSGTGVDRRPTDGPPGKPEANLTPNRFDFGDVPVGTTTAPSTVVLTNTGDAPLNVSAIVLGGAQPGDYLLSAPTLPTAIAPGASISMQVRFAPRDRNARNATIEIVDNAAGEQRVALVGRGQGPEATLSPTRIAYGRVAVGTSVTRTVTILNTGLAPMQVSSATITGAAAADFTVNQGGALTVNPGEAKTLTVTCRPSASGNRTATLEFAHDATGDRRVNLTCVGS